MVIPGWSALVHFDDERTKVVTVFEMPQIGKELVGDISEEWIVKNVKPGGEEMEGQSVSVEVWVARGTRRAHPRRAP